MLELTCTNKLDFSETCTNDTTQNKLNNIYKLIVLFTYSYNNYLLMLTKIINYSGKQITQINKTPASCIYES